MKKITPLLLICMFVLPFNVAAKDKNATDSVAADSRPLGVHPYKQTKNLASDFAHWSLSFEGGFSLIDGDFVQPDVTIIPKTKVRPSGGIALEYSFTPTWGLAGVYTYANYGVKQKKTSDFLLYGHMHSLELLLTYDLVDAWFPRRKTDIFSFYLLAGLGMGFYNCELNLNNEQITPRSDGKYDMVGIITAGVSAEFNVSRELALGVKGLYHIYTGDKLDGKIQGTNNDCMEYCSAFLRWKIGGKKKNHVRNYANDEIFRSKMQSAQKERKPLKDTVVISHTDTVLMVQQIETAAPMQTAVLLPETRYYVYFEHGKAELNEQALIAIQQLAVNLQEDENVCLELNGYCDNTGSEKYNETLAQKRADRVRSELIRVYGIAENRIVAIGKGVITNVNASYGPNRRVEMRLISADECSRLHQTLATTVVTGDLQTSVGNTAQTDEYIAMVKTKKNVTTLSRLARKYYRNTDCWVYIYEANIDVLKNPDMIPENITLRIPRLSDEKMAADNAEAKALSVKYSRK